MDPFDAIVEYGRRRRPVGVAIIVAAGLGLVLGLMTFGYHLSTAPLADVEAYWLAGQRLNDGEPLYPPYLDVNGSQYYFYPPLLAILWRPLALLPFPAAAATWMAILLAALAATIWHVNARRPATWIGLAILGRPLGWALAVGQAQVLVTLFLALGSPFGVALAANIKLFPALAAIYWVGRRDWRQLRRFAVWMGALILLQVVLEPANSLAFLQATNLELVGEVQNLSPYAASPVLWAVLAVGGLLAAWRLAPSRWGWALAVAVSVLATPRLMLYMLSTLLAVLARPTGSAPRARR
jgi:alpha-1,2-mannosyltransferase